jgi:hypothetical protein
MGLLCSSALHSEKHPKASLSTVDVPTEFTSGLLHILKREARTPQWLRYAETLPENSRNACAGFFLDVALRRHMRKTEFREAFELITEATGFGIEVSRLFVQAAEMLNRLTRVVRPEHALVAS